MPYGKILVDEVESSTGKVLTTGEVASELEAIARSLNVADTAVIDSADTATLLDNVSYIYDATAQTTWGVPALDSTGKTIVSVVGSTLTTTGGTGGNSYTLTTINKSGIEFATVADIDNGDSIGGKVSLLIGDSVVARDYAAGNNSGLLFFKVVAAGTGTDDGGKYIDLASHGLQLEQNLKTPYEASAWGAIDDGDKLQSALDYIWSIGGGTLSLGGRDRNYVTTSKLFYNVVDSGNSDKGINIVGDGATITANHSGRALEVMGAFKGSLSGFYIQGDNTTAIGLVIAGANNTSVTDNGGSTGSGKRSEHFKVSNVSSQGCLLGAKFGDGNDQLDYTTVINCYFKGSNGGVVVEEGNTYVTFIETAAHGNSTAEIAWDINNGQAKLIDCYAFSSVWAVNINGNNPITISGLEGENIDNGIRQNYTSTTDWNTKSNLSIKDSQLFLTSSSNVALSLGGFVGATVENSYFGGVLEILDDVNLLQGSIYQETNTYFESRDALYNSSIDYTLTAAKDSTAEGAFFDTNILSRAIDQNLINDSSAPNSMNNGTVTLNNSDFYGTPGAAHDIDFNATVASYLQLRGGTEVLAAGWESALENKSITFGVWMKLDDSEGASENTQVRLWGFEGAYSGTTYGRKNLKLTKRWKYFVLTFDMPATITSSFTFAIRNSVATTLKVNFRAPMITFRGLHHNYYETTGTAKLY